VKEYIQKLFDALSDADDVYNQIPFTSDESCDPQTGKKSKRVL